MVHLLILPISNYLNSKSQLIRVGYLNIQLDSRPQLLKDYLCHAIKMLNLYNILIVLNFGVAYYSIVFFTFRWWDTKPKNIRDEAFSILKRMERNLFAGENLIEINNLCTMWSSEIQILSWNNKNGQLDMKHESNRRSMSAILMTITTVSHTLMCPNAAKTRNVDVTSCYVESSRQVRAMQIT